jgi:hypothetical protein
MKPTLKTNFTSFKKVALLSGPFFHHLDHLSPLAHFLNCPLLVDDATTYQVAKKYYPFVDLFYSPINLKQLSESYDMLILSTKYAKEELQAAYQAMNIHTMRYCYCPHGLSDKGYYDPTMIPETNQDFILLYGERQKEQFKENQNSLLIGNFRLAYYKKFKQFYDNLIDAELCLPPLKKTILYAPTWHDQETGTSFFANWKNLIAMLPAEMNLIIKIHPLLEKYYPADVYRALSFDKTQESLRVLFEMPLIYPLLNRVDVYLGDYSSIGYDFLYFDKPLYFLGERQVPLHKSGVRVDSLEQFFDKLKEPQFNLSKKREESYKASFSPFDCEKWD